MTGLSHLWTQGDAISKAVAALLLLMSIGAWVVIFWKGWLLARARHDLARGVPVFWRASDLAAARSAVQSLDREAVLLPLVDAAQVTSQPGSLEAQVQPEAQLTRRLRDSLHEVLARLQAGQVLLASVGAVSPFVGLLGTVWGIYHALTAIGIAGQASIDKVAGPVGEALIMTAIGLAVAVPAVLGYNWLVRRNKGSMDEVRAFGNDLHSVLLSTSAAAKARA